MFKYKDFNQFIEFYNDYNHIYALKWKDSFNWFLRYLWTNNSQSLELLHNDMFMKILFLFDITFDFDFSNDHSCLIFTYDSYTYHVYLTYYEKYNKCGGIWNRSFNGCNTVLTNVIEMSYIEQQEYLFNIVNADLKISNIGYQQLSLFDFGV